MATKMLILKCLTNLHVGNGDVNYNIVDNEVERDPVTNYPAINSSGVKGALRAFLQNDGNVNKWFGDEKEKSTGQVKILQASMLAMPLRATSGEDAFKLVYTKDMLEQYETLCTNLNVKSIVTNKEQDGKANVEGYELNKMSKVKYKEKEENIYLIKEEYFNKISLPVLARNCLENGKSTNLWYEEVVPHESIFYVPVICDNQDLLNCFAAAVDNKVIQFGGNASIGYGLCKISIVGD